MAAETIRTESPLLDAVRAEQVRLLFAGSGFGLAGTIGSTFVLAGVLLWLKGLSVSVAAAWLAAVTLHTIAGFALGAAYRRARPPTAAWRPWARRYVALSAASGVIWAAVLPWILASSPFELQMLVAAVMAGGTYSMISSTGAYLPAFATFVLPFPTVVAWEVAQGDALHYACAAIIACWLPSVWGMGRGYNRTLVEALSLRFENAALVDGLTQQKHAAEQSSAAKSRFLAAASHDLRQPVQALAFFVGALKGHKLPARSAAIVGHIDASLASMHGLFSSILDMSRLDAGLVKAKLDPVPLEPLLARLVRELEAEAQAKGLTLAYAPTGLSIVSDPSLLERILRNLIGNAVRYTPSGGVLVGARRDGESRVRLEVWDTGPGIAESEREAIFEEFYQLANANRDRAEGLGLGLAIVRRLAGVLGHSVSVASRPGAGTVFRLVAPRAGPAAPARGQRRTRRAPAKARAA